MKIQPGTTKLYLAGFFLLMLALLVFVQAAFNLDPFFSPSEPTQIVLLYTLSTLIFLVLLIFGFVLLRTLIKVWAERKQQKPGSKFKTSLLVSLISLTLIPSVLLFLFAFSLVNRSIVKWFSVPVDQIFTAAADLNLERVKQQEELARGILKHLSKVGESGLNDARRTFGLKAIIVMNEEGDILRSSAEAGVAEGNLANEIFPRMRNKSEAFFDIDPYWIGVQRSGDIVAAVFPRTDKVAQLASKIGQEKEHYNTLAQNQKLYRDEDVYIL